MARNLASQKVDAEVGVISTIRQRKTGDFEEMVNNENEAQFRNGTL